MAMTPKLQAQQGQKLAMTPQLRQAIKLLQYSNIELAEFVEEQLESNPLLERGTGDENRRGEDVSKTEAFDPSTSVGNEPMKTLLANLTLLAKHDFAKLMKVCDVGRETLNDMVANLRNCAPKPGAVYGGSLAAVVQPDVFIRETPNGGWAVELNADTLPRVLVNNRYYNEIKRVGSNDEKAQEFISECHQSANWLVKSLDQRARTILKVASEIVKQQSVRNKIKILISEETEKSIKSDDKIVKLLRAQGIDIARRTVAKYRESMGIPSSVERRRIFKHAV